MSNNISTLELSHDEWLKLRQFGIGGSDVAAILGLSPWKTPRQVYLDKTAPEPVAITENPKMKAGNMLESVVADWFVEETGRKVIRDNKIRIHKEYEYLLANVDRVILPENGEGRGILEVKTTSSFGYDNWEDEIPIPYYCQLMHYLNVTGYQWGQFAVLVNGWDFKTTQIFQRDEEFIQMMNEKLSDFWLNNVQKRIAPEPINTDEVKALYPSHFDGKLIEASAPVFNNITDLKNIKKQIKELEERKETLETSIMNAMGDAEILSYQGQKLATWKKASDSTKFATKDFQAAHPDLYAKYLVDVTGSRRFLIK